MFQKCISDFCIFSTASTHLRGGYQQNEKGKKKISAEEEQKIFHTINHIKNERKKIL